MLATKSTNWRSDIVSEDAMSILMDFMKNHDDEWDAIFCSK